MAAQIEPQSPPEGREVPAEETPYLEGGRNWGLSGREGNGGGALRPCPWYMRGQRRKTGQQRQKRRLLDGSGSTGRCGGGEQHRRLVHPRVEASTGG